MTETFIDPPGPLRIKDVFDRLHADQGIVLPPEVAADHTPGSAQQQGGPGLTRYVWGQRDNQPYLEFYSFHRIWGDYHARIHADGNVEVLDTLETQHAVGTTPEDERRGLEKMHAHNLKVLNDLEAAGLGSGGPVPTSFVANAYLTTGDRTEHTELSPPPSPI